MKEWFAGMIAGLLVASPFAVKKINESNAVPGPTMAVDVSIYYPRISGEMHAQSPQALWKLTTGIEWTTGKWSSIMDLSDPNVPPNIPGSVDITDLVIRHLNSQSQPQLDEKK